jgi:alpha-galactosidase
MALKIAMIGAGSIGFTRRLVRDIVTVPELTDTTFAMTDISQRNLDMVAQLCRRDIEVNELPARSKRQRIAAAPSPIRIT